MTALSPAFTKLVSFHVFHDNPSLDTRSRRLCSLDDVSTTSLSLASDKGGTLADPPESLTEVLGSAYEGGVEGSLVDVVLRNFENRTLVSILMRMIEGAGEVILTTSSAMVKTSDSGKERIKYD